MLNEEEKIKVKNKLAEKHGGEKEHYTIIDFDMLDDEEVSWKLTDTQVIVFGIIAGLAILVTNLLLGYGVYAWSKKCLKDRAEQNQNVVNDTEMGSVRGSTVPSATDSSVDFN